MGKITDMENKERLQTLLVVLGIVAAVVAAASVIKPYQQGSSMIEYYCSPGALFLGIDIPDPFCALSVIGFFTGLMLFVLIVIGVVWISGTNTAKKTIPNVFRTIRHFLTATRLAKITVLLVPVENDYFLTVHNDESWLRADEVTAHSVFRLYLNEPKIEGNIKWFEGGSKAAEVPIPRKSYALLHVATKASDGYIIHFTDRDFIFPIPNDVKPYYKIDVTISGFMSILGYKLKRVRLAKDAAVSFYNDGVVQLD
jgi:hypothetical protein